MAAAAGGAVVGGIGLGSTLLREETGGAGGVLTLGGGLGAATIGGVLGVAILGGVLTTGGGLTRGCPGVLVTGGTATGGVEIRGSGWGGTKVEGCLKPMFFLTELRSLSNAAIRVSKFTLTSFSSWEYLRF